MNQTLEITNNKIMFSRAKDVMKKHFGELRDVDIKNLRDIFLKKSWKAEAVNLKEMRESLELSIPEVSRDLKLKTTDIRKLEKGNDFNKRDVTAQFPKNYFQLRLN